MRFTKEEILAKRENRILSITGVYKSDTGVLMYRITVERLQPVFDTELVESVERHEPDFEDIYHKYGLLAETECNFGPKCRKTGYQAVSRQNIEDPTEELFF